MEDRQAALFTSRRLDLPIIKFFGKKKERMRPSSGATDIEAEQQSISGPTIKLSAKSSRSYQKWTEWPLP